MCSKAETGSSPRSDGDEGSRFKGGLLGCEPASERAVSEDVRSPKLFRPGAGGAFCAYGFRFGAGDGFRSTWRDEVWPPVICRSHISHQSEMVEGGGWG